MTDTQTITELAELNAFRLDEGLTYEVLAEMVGLEPSTLHRALSRPDRKPYDRTLHKIRRFLSEHTETAKVAARSGRR